MEYSKEEIQKSVESLDSPSVYCIQYNDLEEVFIDIMHREPTREELDKFAEDVSGAEVEWYEHALAILYNMIDEGVLEEPLEIEED